MNFGTIIRGEIDLLKLELEKGIDVNQKDEFGNTALHIACDEGYINIVKLLLKYPVNINTKGLHDYTPLLYAISNRNTDLVVLLLKHKANINCQDDEGNSAIMTAVMRYRKGDTSVIETLLEHGADPKTPNKHGITLYKLLDMPRKKEIAHLFE
ncbi:ankyrin repeat domain-containing protein [Dokdonia sp.]|uniref:ankyrin repeat domain-containing protein n=1 Tax=Dokdonia sp. TaxID=2024995 RepID=UPI0032635996